MKTVTHPAAELYRHATGTDLTHEAADALEQMLAIGPDGKFVARETFTHDRTVLEARALAGLFLFGEDVIWSFQRYLSLREAFNRMAALVEGSEVLRNEVARTRRTRGEERIELKSGRRLRFACRNNGRGIRGLSVDCHLFDEALDGPASTHDLERATALLLGVARPNPQLVLCS